MLGALCLLMVVWWAVSVINNPFLTPRPAPSAPGTASGNVPGSVREQPTPAATSTNPKDVTYTIISTDSVPGTKRVLKIRLRQKVSTDILRLIALELKNADRHEYQRTFIMYLLPGMQVGAGAWATTHFDPDLQVKILGLTAEEEEALITEPEPLVG